ncbi:hypothetical protein [Egbenema bharatensis]|uniref:hypothetical protein n=1 Tax=Egbenema bharatensis TaxID=3463334 RepID=UPI003A8441D2
MATVLGVIYLILLVAGEIDPEDRRLKNTDVAILLIVLLINSDLTERLAKFRLGSEGVTLKLEELEEQQDRMNQTQRIQEEEIKDLAGLLVRDLLSTKERDLLKRLAADRPFPYEDKEKFVEDLIQLGDRELIESPSQDELKIEEIPQSSDDLKQFVQVSQLGYICLKFMQKAFSNERLDELEIEEQLDWKE